MKKLLLYGGFAFLIIFECIRVYLIMPMPGSQRNNSIELAYFLGSNKNTIRIIGFYLFYIQLSRLSIKARKKKST